MTVLYVVLGALALAIGAFLLGVYVIAKVLNGFVDGACKSLWR